MHVKYKEVDWKCFFRIQFGAPLARQQLMQYKMGDMLCEISYGLEAALTVGRRMDEGLGEIFHRQKLSNFME